MDLDRLQDYYRTGAYANVTVIASDGREFRVHDWFMDEQFPSLKANGRLLAVDCVQLEEPGHVVEKVWPTHCVAHRSMVIMLIFHA